MWIVFCECSWFPIGGFCLVHMRQLTSTLVDPGRRGVSMLPKFAFHLFAVQALMRPAYLSAQIDNSFSFPPFTYSSASIREDLLEVCNLCPMHWPIQFIQSSRSGFWEATKEVVCQRTPGLWNTTRIWVFLSITLSTNSVAQSMATDFLPHEIVFVRSALFLGT